MLFQKKLFSIKNKYKIHINLLLPGLLYNQLYVYYLFHSIKSQEEYMMVLLANFITIITTTMFAMKFWKEQYVINIISVFVVLVFYYISLESLNHFVGNFSYIYIYILFNEQP